MKRGKIRVDLDGSGRRVEVDAQLVDGEEGVFAVWRDGDIVQMAGGDDGAWWLMGSYHVRWVPEMIKALEAGSKSRATR